MSSGISIILEAFSRLPTIKLTNGSEIVLLLNTFPDLERGLVSKIAPERSALLFVKIEFITVPLTPLQ